jgi:hypothetical protein
MGISNGLNAFGTLLQRGDGVTPIEGFTTVAELTNIELPAVESEILELTHHTSPGGFKEWALGLKDGGEVAIEGNYVPKDATQRLSTGVLGDNVSGVKRNWKVLFPDGIAAIAAALNSVFTDPNANIKYTAVTPGVGGNAISVTHVVPAGAGAALTIGVVGNAITVNSATAAAGVASSTAAQVIAAVIASAPAAALVTPSLGANATGAGIINALALANLAGGAAAVAQSQWSFVAFMRNFRALAPSNGKLSFRGTLKITGQPVLA